jgi:protein O-mannosyl-transferase
MKTRKARSASRSQNSEARTVLRHDKGPCTDQGIGLETDPRCSGDKPPGLFPAWALGLIFLGFLGVGWGLQSSGFQQSMIYDSREWIANRADVFATHEAQNVVALFPVRPLFMLSLYANYLWHGMDPYYFRAVNVVILALAAVILVVLTALVFEIPGLTREGSTRGKQVIAVFVGLWFAVHPLQTLVVLYDWQRSAIMACFFYFAALASYVAGRSSRLGGVWAYSLTGTLFLAGLMSKEHSATLPLMLIATEATLFRQSLRQVLNRAAVIAMITVPVLVTYLLVTDSLHAQSSFTPDGVIARLREHYSATGLTLPQVVLTECRVWFSYLSMILAPFSAKVQLVRPEVISVSLWEPPSTGPAAAGVVALVATGVTLIRRQPLAALGILSFFITLLPESLLVAAYLFCGYRAILPMAGVLFVMAEVLLWASVRCRKHVPVVVFRAICAAVLAVPLVWMGSITYSRAHGWNPLSFWQEAFASLPSSPKNLEVWAYYDIINGLGDELTAAGRYEEAIAVLTLAERRVPGTRACRSLRGKWFREAHSCSTISVQHM